MEVPEPADPDVNPETPVLLDPMVTADQLGRIAYLNYLWKAYQNKGVDAVVLGNIKNQVASNQGINVMAGDEISQMLLDAGVAAPGGDNPKDAVFPDNIDTIFAQLKSKYGGEDNPQMGENIDQALAKARQASLNQDASGNNVQTNFTQLFTQELQKTKGGRMASRWSLASSREVNSLDEAIKELSRPDMEVIEIRKDDPIVAGMIERSFLKTAQPVDPLVMQPFQSVDDMKARLIEMGRPMEGERSEESLKRVYEKVLAMVGPEHEDRAKAAVKAFYQFGKVADLWSLFQELGLAAPIDQEVIGEIMENNPDLFNKEAKAGLFLPPNDASLHALPEGMTKTAGGGVGGAGAGYPAYEFEGSNRYCPKIRNVVNTFVCRYHCLDGLKIDDAQVVCGEAIWRQTVADKFSREYRNADGEWVGGYLNKRFEIHRDDGGHPYQLTPGKRHAPIHEDAWSYEKRLQEMRKAEGKKRGYGPVSGEGEKEKLYNFDQHEIMGGPESSTLGAKPRDPLAKNASCGTCGLRTATQEDHPYMGLDPREGYRAEELFEEHVSKGKPLTQAEVDEIIRTVRTTSGALSIDDFEEKNGLFWFKQPEFDESPPPTEASTTWAVKTAKKSELDKKFDRCVEDVKEKGTAENPYAVCMVSTGKGEKRKGKSKKKAFNLRRIAVDNGNPLLDGVDMGPKAKACAACGKKFALTYSGVCDVCGCAQLVTKSDGDIKSETHAVDKPEFALDIKASEDVEVRYANGVFMASRGAKRAYGESASVAVEKLAAVPEDVSVEELGEELKKDETEPLVEEVPVTEAEPLETVDATPTTEEIPMGEAPEPNPFEAMASDANPPPNAAALQAREGEPLAEGDNPLEQKEDEENYDELMGI